MGILQMPNFHMCRCPKKGLFFVFFGHRANSLEGHERIGGLRIHLRYTAALSLPWANSLEGHERIGVGRCRPKDSYASSLLGAELARGN